MQSDCIPVVDWMLWGADDLTYLALNLLSMSGTSLEISASSKNAETGVGKPLTSHSGRSISSAVNLQSGEQMLRAEDGDLQLKIRNT